MNYEAAPRLETERGAASALAPQISADSELWISSWMPEVLVRTSRWALRASGGVTSRANSAIPQRSANDDPNAALVELEVFYRDRDLVPRVQLPARWRESALEKLLLARGYDHDSETFVQTVAVGEVPQRSDRSAHGLSIEAHPSPSRTWRELYVDESGFADPLRDALSMAILTRTPSSYISLLDGSETVGIARVTAIGDVAMLTGMVVAPSRRGNGLGRPLLQAVLAESASLNCATVALQVTAHNEAARKLYAGAGFSTVDGYSYLAPSQL